jgi:hypothetical protein
VALRFVERRGRDLNPRRTQRPEAIFETVRKTPYAGIFVLVRQFVRHDSALFAAKTDNGSKLTEFAACELVFGNGVPGWSDQARVCSRRRVTSPPVSSRVRCRLEVAATNVAAPPRPTSSAQGRKDPRTLPPGRPQFQAWPPWCRRRSRRSPDRSGRWRVSLPRPRRGCTAARRPRSLPLLRRIALVHRRRFQFDVGRRDSGKSRLEPALPRR